MAINLSKYLLSVKRKHRQIAGLAAPRASIISTWVFLTKTAKSQTSELPRCGSDRIPGFHQTVLSHRCLAPHSLWSRFVCSVTTVLSSSRLRPISSGPISAAGRSTSATNSRSKMRPARRVSTQILHSIGPSTRPWRSEEQHHESTTDSVPPQARFPRHQFPNVRDLGGKAEVDGILVFNAYECGYLRDGGTQCCCPRALEGLVWRGKAGGSARG